MPKTKKITKKQPKIKDKDKTLSLAAMILGYITIGLFIINAVLALIVNKTQNTTLRWVMWSIIILSHIVAILFAGAVLTKTQKHDDGWMKTVDLVVGIITIVSVGLLVLSAGLRFGLGENASKALHTFMYLTFSLADISVTAGCIFTTIDYVRTKKLLSQK